MSERTLVHRRAQNDLLPEVLGTVYWTEQVGYQANIPFRDGTTKVLDVEFINDEWYILEGTPEGYKTDASGKIPRNEFGVGYWPDQHPKNPKNLVLAVAPSFGDYISQGIEMTNPGPSKKAQKEAVHDTKEENGGNSLQGKVPEVFDGNRANSKAFISDIRIYFLINRNKPDIKNYYSRTLLALSFIKGPNVVNWVNTQINEVNDNLDNDCGGDKNDSYIWKKFAKRFIRAFVSSTAKESAYVKMQSLKMKGDQLDEYIADHSTLIAELDWDGDSEMSCHSFREGLPPPLAKQVIQMEGIPESLTQWINHVQTYHSRWAMTRALGYSGKKKKAGRFKQRWNPRERKKERDPDAMDVDFTKMSQDERESLMKSGSCFKCKQKGHMAKDCPRKQAVIREATTEDQEWTKVKSKKKQTQEPPSKEKPPPSYNSILEQINKCSMEDRQKILEVFSQDEDSGQEDF